jgi:hypothetical protein
MAREVTTTGSKLLSTLMKEFNKNFPYLILVIGPIDTQGCIHQVDVNKTLSEIRTKKGKGELSFSGNKLVKTIEREFKDLYGISAQIGIKQGDGLEYYSAGVYDDMTLSQFNLAMKNAGCQKGVWRFGL